MGHIYFLINTSFPGLVKIGFTTRSLDKRVSELHSTGVPTPFRVGASFWVNSPAEVERMIHKHLKEFRDQADREFFAISLQGAVRRSIEYIVPELCLDGDPTRRPTKPTIELNNIQLSLLEFALGDEDLSRDLVYMVSSEVEYPKQLVWLNADKLVDMNLFKTARNGYVLTPEGRSLCFEDERIMTEHVL